jgi:transglutaminase-like putative cysteine protease
MKRPLIWLIRCLGPETLISVTLLLVVLGSVALGLADTIRSLDAGVLLPMALLGLLLGWGLAKSPLPGWLGGLVALGLGIEVIFLRVGRLGGPLMVLLRALVAGLAGLVEFIIWGGWRLSQPGRQLSTLPDGTPILPALGELWADVSTLLVRLRDWVWAWVMGESTFDLAAAAIAWGLVLWAVAAWAGWWVRRRDQPLPGIVPAGLLLGITLFFGGGEPAFLVALLAGALLLMVSIRQDTRERRWTETGIDFPLDAGLEAKAVGAGLSLMLVTMAALAPSISVQQVIDWAERLTGRHRDRVQVVVGRPGQEVEDVNPTSMLDEDQVRAPGLPRRHLIGSGPELSEQVVMVIYPTEDEVIGDESSPAPSGPVPGASTLHYYWRGLTYNQYTGNGWITGSTETLEYQAEDVAVYRDPFEPVGVNYQNEAVIPPGRRKVSLEVRATVGLGELLHVAGDLVTVDQDYLVAWRSAGDAFGATISLTDPALARTNGPKRAPRPGDSGIQTAEDAAIVYRTDSLIPSIGEAQLRTAKSEYPVWIRDRYLALPADVPPRVLALARDLTATEATPYDRARAIESYLRTFPYSLDLPPPRGDRDVVDYFLFELKQGYCDYYATSMVVLARAAGLPARLVVGYHTGTYDEVNQRYLVTAADAHAWVEIFFPGYGWVEFEPTAGVSPIDRPADVPPIVPNELDALGPAGIERAGVGRLWWLGLLGMVGLASLICSGVDSWRLRRLSPEVAAATLYWRLSRHGRRLSVPTKPGDTPYEYITSLAECVRELAATGAWATVITPLAQEARWLASLYVRTCYGPYYADAADQQQAIRTWRRLHRRLWLALVYRGWTRVTRFTLASSRSAHHVERLPGG